MSYPVRSIVVVGSAGIGDLISHVPLLENLHRVFPDASIDCVTKRKSRFFDGIYPFINKFIELDKKNVLGSIHQMAKLWTGKYDLLVRCCPEANLKSALLVYILCMLIQAKKKWRHPQENLRDMFLNRNISGISAAEIELGILRVNGVKEVGPANKISCFVNIDECWQELNHQFDRLGLTEFKGIVIHAGAKKGYEARLWDPEKWSLLIKKIKSNYSDMPIFLVGGSDDVEINRILKNLCGENIIDMTNRLESKALMGLISLASVVICTNSGIAHIASIFEKPSVVITGPSKKYWDPVNKNAIVIRNNKCEILCDRAKCIRKDNKYVCIRDINVAEVYLRCQNLLENIKKGKS